jgi:hypothetical protein
MDTQESVAKKVQELVDRVNDRKYYGRRMVVDIHTHSDDMKTFTVKGNLKLSVSETPNDKESWINKKFSVMFIDTDPDMAIAEVFVHLNSIPMEYGDTIFEDDFEEVIKLMEDTDDQAQVATEETPIQ